MKGYSNRMKTPVDPAHPILSFSPVVYLTGFDRNETGKYRDKGSKRFDTTVRICFLVEALNGNDKLRIRKIEREGGM